MTKPLSFAVLTTLIVTALVAAEEELPGGAIGLVRTVGNKEVQQELKLSDDEIATANEAAELLAKVRDGKAQAMAIETLRKGFTPDHYEQGLRIFWRRLGGRALFEPEVRERLKVTPDQVEQLKEARAVNEAEHAKMVDFMRRARFRSAEAMAAYVKKYADAADERLFAVLSEEQRKAFAELVK